MGTTAYNRSFSFSNYQSLNPSTPLPGSSLDTELNAVKAATDSLSTNLGLIQRNDGALANGSVGRDQLSSSLLIGFGVPTVWAPNTPYLSSPISTVFANNKFYSCAVSHTSGSSFATDLAAGKWTQIADLSGIPLVTADQIAITPSGGVVTSNVQSAMYGLDGRITATAASLAAFASTSITDSTTIGRALLTAASSDAALTTLSAWDTGDIKLTIRQTARTGWLLMNDGTIGNAASGATAYASALAWPLYEVLWNVGNQAWVPVTTGRGASAAADFAANKPIALLKALGRALAISGAGSGLTSRDLGQFLGTETVTVGQANLPNVTLATTIAAGQGTHTHTATTSAGTPASQGGAGSGNILSSGTATVTIADATLPAMSGTTPLGGSGTALSIVQPTTFLNAMIKL